MNKETTLDGLHKVFIAFIATQLSHFLYFSGPINLIEHFSGKTYEAGMISFLIVIYFYFGAFYFIEMKTKSKSNIMILIKVSLLAPFWPKFYFSKK